jgi:Holliday junction resolvase
MGAKSRRKGARCEREIVDLHHAIGIAAERVPLSGAAGGSFCGDVRIPGLGTAEVKSRAGGAGFVTLTRWLGDNAALFLRRDRAEPIVVLPWATYARVIKPEPQA